MVLNNQLTFFDAFSGIGGFRIGLERSNFKCIGFCDNDKYVVQLYKAYFNTKEELYFNDITTLDTRKLPDFDIFCGGFPCQAFSIAGKRHGFNDSRGTLFFEIARILKDKKPKFFILENVKGLLSHDSGRTFQTILKILTDLGYQVQWQLLNSKFFGVPQNRERVFIVGCYGKECIGKIFPIRNQNKTDVRDDVKNSHFVLLSNKKRPMIKTVSNTIDANYYKGFGNQYRTGIIIGTIRTYKSGNGFRKMKSDLCPTIPARAREDGNGLPAIAFPVLTPSRIKKRQNGRRFKNNNEVMFTLTGQDIHGIYDGYRIRRLTPLECFRLQGFPDDMVTTAQSLGISDSRLYKMAGNAVTVNVVEAVARQLVKAIENRKI